MTIRPASHDRSIFGRHLSDVTFDPSANLEGEGLTGNTEAGHQEADRSFKALRRQEAATALLLSSLIRLITVTTGWRSAPLPVRHGGKRSVTCDTLGQRGSDTASPPSFVSSPQVSLPRRQNWPVDDLAERQCSSLAPIKIPECWVLTLPVPPLYIIIIITVFQKVLPAVLTLIYCSCNQILPCAGPAARRVLMRVQENRVAANKTPQMWKLLTANQVVTLGGSWCCWWEEAEPVPRRQLAAVSQSAFCSFWRRDGNDLSAQLRNI